MLPPLLLPELDAPNEPPLLDVPPEPLPDPPPELPEPLPEVPPSPSAKPGLFEPPHAATTPTKPRIQTRIVASSGSAI